MKVEVVYTEDFDTIKDFSGNTIEEFVRDLARVIVEAEPDVVEEIYTILDEWASKRKLVKK